MLPYLLRLTLWLALPITLLSLLMPALGQMNPRRDWIVYVLGQQEIVTLHDLERHFSAPIPGFPNTFTLDLNAHGELAYAGSADDQNDVRIFNVHSSVNNPQVIYTAPASTRFYQFYWSPDGHYLAFVGSEDNQGARVFVWNGEMVVSVNPPGLVDDVNFVRWSPDNRLAFRMRPLGQVEGRSFPSEVYIWDGQQTLNLSQTPDQDDYPFGWSRDGRLAYVSYGLRYGDTSSVLIWNGENSTLVFSDVSGFFTLYWNAENELTLSVAQPDASSLFQIYRRHGEQIINISPDANRGYAFQRWSQDGRWAVSVMNQAGYEADSIQVRNDDQQLLLDVPGILYPIWTEAGSLLFCQRQPQSVVLQRWDGERIRPVVQGTFINMRMPNGRSLVCQ
ncbi:MAG: PD40 domain-containing protein [Anaerolineae bacterium]|nr:PD40 domain-containing protein [Anaerolineae bacterium]